MGCLALPAIPVRITGLLGNQCFCGDLNFPEDDMDSWLRSIPDFVGPCQEDCKSI